MVRDTDKTMYSGTVKREEKRRDTRSKAGRQVDAEGGTNAAEHRIALHYIALKTQKIAACFSGNEPGGRDQG